VSVPWSHDFDDIRGADDAPSQDRPNSDCRTRVKMMWDDNYLYILAMIESDMEVRATFTERNSPIFQQDSDFEVFIDPLSSCHNYKELEMNALNTVWNLMLDKPYWDGGIEHSGRIAKPGDEHYYDVYKQKTAVKIIEGSMNKPSSASEKTRTVWAVEIALSHGDTLRHVPIAGIPAIGDKWRINFSRVEKKGKINWTWQKQRVWDPKIGKHIGKVDMHLPDAWAYIEFGKSLSSYNYSSGEKPGEVPHNNIKNGDGDQLWPLKLAVMNVYYAQRRYKELNSQYVNDFNALKPFLDHNIWDPLISFPKYLSCNNSKYVFQIFNPSGQWVSVNHERLVLVENDEQLKSIE